MKGMRPAFRRPPPRASFWVTNTCNRNVSLSDLNLTIKAYASVDLLDNKHYSYNKERLEKSQANGSLYAKRSIISVRSVPPPIPDLPEIPILLDAVIPDRQRSIFQITQVEYDELRISDEDFARQSAEMEEDPEISAKTTKSTKG